MIKKFFLSRFDGFVVPGSSSAEYLTSIYQMRSPVYLLPNVINQHRFKRSPLSNKSAILPARLVEDKGIIEFLSILNQELLNGWKIHIYGEGELKKDLLQLIKKKTIQDAVEIYPYVAYEEMYDLYSNYSLFILPSITDPNPLTVVEALSSGLPLLVSTRLGNVPEAFNQANGWSFDPLDQQDITLAVRNAFTASFEELQSAARESLRLSRFWNGPAASRKFVHEAIDTHATQSL
jgi:glycosyltransferase involved in cell wall biosynthesis